ncbi:proton-dependent oligopeptide transporter family [Artemisia annua]|uniref:Proton-dependent oligopeptide transporter family n=1 Tax=Artemisia annua TaxID=35608 RepID=A0A2U1QID0_ARTAN|nr:proton-dependent oligopeptide transporter family [Artemisia annua]
MNITAKWQSINNHFEILCGCLLVTFLKPTPNSEAAQQRHRLSFHQHPQNHKTYMNGFNELENGSKWACVKTGHFCVDRKCEIGCLDKAAIKLPEKQPSNRWKVCSVREVEDTKIGIRMLPMWLTFIVIGIVLSIGNTYFLEQANHMDRKLGKIKVPIPIFLLFYSATSNITAYFYSLLTTCIPRKYAPPVGIASGMLLSVLCCITAAKVETRRLHRIRDHGLLDKPDEMIPMSIFALLPQFMLLAAVDGIANNSINSFFKHQAPKSVRKYLTYFTKGVLGLGTAASVLSVYIVGKVSERNQKPNWFQYTLNRSRLDRYYWVLSALSAANLVIFTTMLCTNLVNGDWIDVLLFT